MKTYLVYVEEIQIKPVEIEAESEYDAQRRVRALEGNWDTYNDRDGGWINEGEWEVEEIEPR